MCFDMAIIEALKLATNMEGYSNPHTKRDVWRVTHGIIGRRMIIYLGLMYTPLYAASNLAIPID